MQFTDEDIEIIINTPIPTLPIQRRSPGRPAKPPPPFPETSAITPDVVVELSSQEFGLVVLELSRQGMPNSVICAVREYRRIMRGRIGNRAWMNTHNRLKRSFVY